MDGGSLLFSDVHLSPLLSFLCPFALLPLSSQGAGDFISVNILYF
uniref:Uncharacterized protein n=1 Tax=Anguilla anguilla TaxID=7936 RepID=A0A0E9VPL6_ANGAN